MHRIGDEVHLRGDEARAGETPHIMRYILAISLLLAIGTLSILWITAASGLHPRHGWAVTAEEYALGNR